jgi:threonine dehydrogenase-like Zn-dependent dehydrogenase
VVDYVFVTVGAKAAIPQALAMAARSGTVVLVGMPASGVTVAVDPGDIAHNNLRVLGSKMGRAFGMTFPNSLYCTRRAFWLDIDLGPLSLE